MRNHDGKDPDYWNEKDGTEEPFEPDESFWDEEEDEGDGEDEKHRRTWVRKVVAWLIVAALGVNVLAFWPQVYSWESIRFLIVSNTLSKDETIALHKDSIVSVSSGKSKGTGFQLNGGYIVTNHHVAGSGESLMVKSELEESGVRAELIASDPSIDIAVLKRAEEGDAFPALKPAEDWQIGETVHIIGNPLFFSRIVNKGSIVGLTQPGGWEQPVMTIDAPVFKGNSGSPVLNEDGDVVGVVFATQDIQQDGKRQKLGLAVPIQYVVKLIEELGD
ncbi:S1C family serine protease [Paenibacillus sp. CAU 1782]